MELNILESIFFAISKITQVKTYNKRLGNYSVEDDILTGKIYVDIDYYDFKMDEIFVTKEIDFTIILKENMEIENVEVSGLKLEVIDNQGINCYYEVVLSAKMIERKKEDFQEISKKETLINENLKQEIKENYDNLLTESLEKRKDEEEEVETMVIVEKEEELIGETIELEEENYKKVEIISTVDDKDERGFLDFFDNSRTNYKIIKKIKVIDESSLNKISKDYNISIDELYTKYDKENSCVTISVNEKI